MHNNQSGQTLVEVLVAAAVGTLVVSALTFTAVFSIRNASFAKSSAQATKLAQEGIERVRIGRNRNSSISNLQNVTSWNGSQPIWNYQISGSGNCGDLSFGQCYFNITPLGALSKIDVAALSFPGSPPAEEITSVNQKFQRVVILSDDGLDPATQKKVTVIVRWTDATGPHESKLVTILRKL